MVLRTLTSRIETESRARVPVVQTLTDTPARHVGRAVGQRGLARPRMFRTSAPRVLADPPSAALGEATARLGLNLDTWRPESIWTVELRDQRLSDLSTSRDKSHRPPPRHRSPAESRRRRQDLR